MIKQLAWNTFKNTGSIDTYLELVQMKNLENNVVNTKINNLEDDIADTKINNIESDIANTKINNL